MALTQLADVIIPAVYLSYTAVDGPELTAFYESGVVVRNEAINAAIQTGGKTVNMPFWKDLDATVEPNYSTDNPADVAVPNKVTADNMIAAVAEMNQGYSAADLVSELAGSDPMQRIRNRFGKYWSRQFQRRIIKTCVGLVLENVANGGSDMIQDNSIPDGNNAGAANLFSRDAMVNAVFTLGDHFDNIMAIAVHSLIFARMVKNDDIVFERPATPDPNLPLSKGVPYYLGKRVIVDDGLPVVAGGVSGFVFTSILFGEGAIGYGERSPRVPVEVYRRPDQGNGGGIEQVWERKSWSIHPFGYKFTSANVAAASGSPTFAEMALAANWTRLIERKNVPLAFLKTNG
jgi:hypothetical protein